MEARRRTWFDERGVVVGGASVPFYAGAMHYWRVERSRWAACLATMKAQGLTIVETYVPWRVHEPARGAFAWDGPRDLRAFCAAAKAAGLAVVVRPGPHVNAELTSFGMPDWVLADPDVQARTQHGTPVWMPSPPRAFPVPSYASAAFHAHVRAWYAAVASQVDDSVIAVGVDNEAQRFFRLGAYDADYHPDAIAWWREASGLDGEPPRAWDPADAARCLSWVRFADQYLARALGAFGAMLDEVGLDVARFHNLPPGHHGLSDLRGIQRALGGPVGIDAYTPRADFPALRRRALNLVGNAAPIPLAPEVGIGWVPWLPPLDAGDDPTRERDHLLTLLAAGVRGFDLFMMVERDRYYGAAIDKRGALESHAAWIAPLVAALAEIDWPSLRRHAPGGRFALVSGAADARFGLATCLVDPMTPVLAEALDLGPGGSSELGADPAARLQRRWQLAIASALESAQLPYAIVDDATPLEELSTYRVVIAPTLGRIDRGLFERLRHLAEHKLAAVVIGPVAPTHDEFDQPLATDPLRRVGRLKAGSLDDLPGLASDLAGLAAEQSTWVIERPETARAFAHADASGTVRCVFVVSDADKPTTAIIAAEGTLRDVFTGERLTGTIALPPRGVRMFIVE